MGEREREMKCHILRERERERKCHIFKGEIEREEMPYF